MRNGGGRYLRPIDGEVLAEYCSARIRVVLKTPHF